MRDADSMRIISSFRRPTRSAGTSRHTILRAAGAAATGVVLTILAAVTATPAIAVEPFHFPAVLRSGKKVGDLVPGISALNDVVKMFPAAAQDYPGNPRPPATFPEVKIGKVRPEPTTVYNPLHTSYALFFDDNDKLVIIEDAHPALAGLGPEAIHQRYPQLKGTGHDERVIELQGQVEPCVVMMVLFSAATRKVTKVAYAFTCPTAGSESTRRDEIPSSLRSIVAALAQALSPRRAPGPPSSVQPVAAVAASSRGATLAIRYAGWSGSRRGWPAPNRFSRSVAPS
jgi:hypothetical protein